MTTLLNGISVLSSFVFGVGVLYWIMDVTIGKLKFLHSETEWNGLQYKDFIFLAASCMILLTTVSFYQPY